MRRAVLLVVLVVAGVSAQGPAAQPVDVDRLGPQVGDIVPDVAAVDQFGRTQTLPSLMGANGLMLFFNRSADW